MKGSMNIFFVVVVALLQSRRIMVQQLDNYVQCKWQLESASELIERGIFFCCAAAEPRKCEEATTRRRRRRVRKASQKDSKVSVAFGERRGTPAWRNPTVPKYFRSKMNRARSKKTSRQTFWRQRPSWQESERLSVFMFIIFPCIDLSSMYLLK